MTQDPNKKKQIVDKSIVQDVALSLIVLFIIAATALLIGEDSVDSARAVFWAIIAMGATGLPIYLFLRFRRRKLKYATIDQTLVSPNFPVATVPDIRTVQGVIDKRLEEQAVVDHDQLFGVDDLLNEIKGFLNDPTGSWIVSLFGEGGVGKTAVTYEAVRRYATKANITRFAWVSAKQRYFSSDPETQVTNDTKLQWADLVRQIANQLGLELGYSRTTWLDDFQRIIKQLPQEDKCLIVIDNLETIEDVSVIQYFDDPNDPSKRIINPHKVLVTTRRSILEHSQNVIELSLTGLKPHSAYQLIRFLGRGNKAIASATEAELRPILDVTEGNPFLIKLIVRRFLVSRKPIPLVLQELRDLNSANIAASLKDYLYVQSLQELEKNVGEEITKQLMNAFCPRPAGELLSYEELFKYSRITNEELFEQARKMACDLSLIRVSGSALNSMYSIHSLLWEFTCGSS